MTEWKLFDGPPPEYTTAAWYAGRDRAAHLEQDWHRPRLLAAGRHVRDLAERHGLKTAVDLGCGDGGLLSLLSGAPGIGRCWGYDLCPAAVNGARLDRGVDAYLLDVIAEPGKVRWGALAVATELLEHLAGPHDLVRQAAKHSRAIVASSPVHESDLLHYEFHAWAWDMAGYRALIEQGGFTITRHEVIGGHQVISGVIP